MEMLGTLDGETLDGETLDGENDGGRGQMETWDEDIRWGDVGGECWMGRWWMEVLAGDTSSVLPPFTGYFTFLAENNPRNVPALPPFAPG